MPCSARSGHVTRVVLADDHPRVRAALRRALARQEDFAVVGEAADGRSAAIVCAVARPDAALIDLRMPFMDGIELARRVAATVPDARIVVFSALAGGPDSADAVANGATTVVAKDAPFDVVLAALRAPRPSAACP